MRERPTARVLLLDARDRILLMKGRLPSDPGAPGAWFALGGGAEPGETMEAAAAREVAEETGFSDVLIGPVVFRRDAVFRDARRRPVLFKETYFVARCAGGPVSRALWQAHEHEFIDDIRWWTLADLRANREPIVPETLPDLFETCIQPAARRVFPGRPEA